MKKIILLINIFLTLTVFGQNELLNFREFEFQIIKEEKADDDWIKPIIDAKRINDLMLYFKYKSPILEIQNEEIDSIEGEEVTLGTNFYKFIWKSDYEIMLKFTNLPEKKPYELLVRFPVEGLIYVVDYFNKSEDFKNEHGLQYILKVANQENTWYNMNTGLYYGIIKMEDSSDLLLFVRGSGATNKKGYSRSEEGYLIFHTD